MKLEDIFLVVVLYKTKLEDTKTINSLDASIASDCNLFVFDNSPIKQYELAHFKYKNFEVHYFHNANNPGLSTAYNSALNKCNKLNKKWLLLLDQDTTFTKEYISEIKSLDLNKLPPAVVAVMPNVVSMPDGRIIAPVKMFLGGICRPVTIENFVVTSSITGINSGTLLNAFYMNEIGGFSEKYTLDMLDHWYFRKFFNDGKSVYVLKSKIFQDLSVFGNFEENVSFNRYQQMLKSELLFMEDEGKLSNLVFKFRLLYRALKQLQFKNSDFYKFTLNQIFK